VLSNLQGVIEDLLVHVERRASGLTPSPTLPLSGGGKTAADSGQGA
jgi:hypothetical protein